MGPACHKRAVTCEEFKRLGHEFLTSTLSELDHDTLVALGNDLESQNEWSYLTELCEYLIVRAAMPQELHAAYLMAQRAMSNSLGALRFAESLTTPSTDRALCLQIASLLSELGNYEAVIATLQSHFTDNDDHAIVDLLVLQAWAYENCLGIANAEHAFLLYKRIISGLNSQTPAEAAAYVSPHPEARTGRHDFGLIRSLWAQRGCGNVLRVVPGQREAAERYWREVVSRVKSLDAEPQHDPYIERITAWCHFRLGDFDAALKGYRRTLDSGIAKYRPQLEHALVLFIIGRVSASIDQFEKAVYDLRDIDAVKRCGFLRSALGLFVTVVSELGLSMHPDAKGIVDILWKELDSALTPLSPGIPQYVLDIRHHLQLFVDTLPSGLGAHDRNSTHALQIIEWASVTVVGLEDPQEQLCGVFPPIVEYEGKRYSCVADVDERGELSGPPRLGDETERVTNFPSTRLPRPTSQILYLSGAAKTILDSWSIWSPLLSESTWFPTGNDNAGSVTCIENTVAIQALDEIAAALLSKAFSILTRVLSEPRPRLAEESALLGFSAATRLETIYQAALVYLNLSQAPVDLRLSRRNKWPTRLPAAEELGKRAKTFGDLVDKVAYSEAMTLDSKALSSLAEDVIRRGETTSAIKDPQKRALEAVWAASEAQLLVGQSLPMASLQEQLATAISRATIWYLSRDVDTLALAQEPAFYCAVHATKLSRPMMDVFSYFKAPFKADSNKFEEGPIAVRAKRSPR